MKSTKQQYLSKAKVNKLPQNTWVEIAVEGDTPENSRMVCLLIKKPKTTSLWYECYFPTLGIVKQIQLDRVVKIHGPLDYPTPGVPDIRKPKIGDALIGQLKLSRWLPVIFFTTKIQALEEDVVYADLILTKERLETVLSPEASVAFTKHVYTLSPYEDELEFVSDGKWSCGEINSFQIEKSSKVKA